VHVLALEPYHGGSHAAFLEGWARHSRHRFTLLTLPAHKWKWRMRHAAITFADRLAAGDAGPPGDVDCLVAGDMLNLAEFRGLAPAPLRGVPSVLYMHENQLTYPDRVGDPRDLHFGFTNLTSALAAEEVWWNSAWHRDAFLPAARELVKRMPGHAPTDAPDRIAAASRVEPPGIEPPPARTPESAGPLHLLWAARWEHDKRPEDFFAAVDRLAEAGVDFRLSVIGESFRRVPGVFAAARRRHAARLVRWGYQENRAAYARALQEAHVAVSTAGHEFFGLAMVEAAAAGCLPLVPRRLAYPEVFAEGDEPIGDFFYDGTVEHLAARLVELADRHAAGALWRGDARRGRRVAERYAWANRAPALDGRLAALAGG
jgi:glycosyltransferase involved in cell wall biosynthesis